MIFSEIKPGEVFTTYSVTEFLMKMDEKTSRVVTYQHNQWIWEESWPTFEFPDEYEVEIVTEDDV